MSQSPARKRSGEATGERTFYPEWLVEALESQNEESGPQPPRSEPKPAAHGHRTGGRSAPDAPDPSDTGAAGLGEAGLDDMGLDDLGLDDPADWLKFDWPEPELEEPGANGNGSAPPRRRHLYLGFESTRVPPRSFRCRVMIQLDGHEYVGEATGPEIPGVRAEITARATLDALKKAENNRVELALLGARVMRVFDRPIAIVGVYGLDDDIRPLIGACIIRESIEQASALATLQATNRWLSWEIARQDSR